jgi:8-oxo-dGTP pyrophosphatase MutT (NUDIX family)
LFGEAHAAGISRTPAPLAVSMPYDRGMLTRDSFCSFCGTAFAAPLAYPRTCAQCQTQIWANPIPVSVVLVPVQAATGIGLLVVRRAIQPQLGKLGLVGGFLEDHESWQQGGAREVFEEAGVVIDPASIAPLWFASSSPKPNRVLLFGVAPTIELVALPPFTPNHESTERGLVFGPAGLSEIFAFSLHVEAATRFFAQRGIAANAAAAFTAV